MFEYNRIDIMFGFIKRLFMKFYDLQKQTINAIKEHYTMIKTRYCNNSILNHLKYTGEKLGKDLSENIVIKRITYILKSRE